MEFITNLGWTLCPMWTARSKHQGWIYLMSENKVSVFWLFFLESHVFGSHHTCQFEMKPVSNFSWSRQQHPSQLRIFSYSCKVELEKLLELWAIRDKRDKEKLPWQQTLHLGPMLCCFGPSVFLFEQVSCDWIVKPKGWEKESSFHPCVFMDCLADTGLRA